MPPIICTSKWRIPKTRLLASRTTAKASGNILESDSSLDKRSLNSAVFAFSSSSERASITGSKAFIFITSLFICLINRSLRLPNIFVINFTNILLNHIAIRRKSSTENTATSNDHINCFYFAFLYTNLIGSICALLRNIS